MELQIELQNITIAEKFNNKYTTRFQNTLESAQSNNGNFLKNSSESHRTYQITTANKNERNLLPSFILRMDFFNKEKTTTPPIYIQTHALYTVAQVSTWAYLTRIPSFSVSLPLSRNYITSSRRGARRAMKRLLRNSERSWRARARNLL